MGFQSRDAGSLRVRVATGPIEIDPAGTWAGSIGSCSKIGQESALGVPGVITGTIAGCASGHGIAEFDAAVFEESGEHGQTPDDDADGDFCEADLKSGLRIDDSKDCEGGQGMDVPPNSNSINV